MSPKVPTLKIFVWDTYTHSPSCAQVSRSIRKPLEEDHAKATRRRCKAGAGLGEVRGWSAYSVLLKVQVEIARSTLGQGRDLGSCRPVDQ